jgi:hypothetical protein
MEDKQKGGKPDNSYERILALENEVQKLSEKLKELQIGKPEQQEPKRKYEEPAFDEPEDIRDHEYKEDVEQATYNFPPRRASGRARGGF